MSASQREKGKVGEREVVNIALALGLPIERDWESQSKPGGQKDGDFRLKAGGMGIPEFYLECRRRERLDISAWIRELEEKAPGRNRALVFRRSREPWYVALPLEQFIALLKAAS